MGRLRGSVFPCAVLIALGLACFARLVADPTELIVDGARPSVDHANHGDPRPVGNDATFLFLPHHLYIARVLNEFGHLPAWDASGFGGRPMVGNPQGGMFYPPVWFAWLIPSPAVLGWLTVIHLLWGGLGLYVLARAEGLGRWPATVAAGAFQASPYLLAQTFEGHYPHVWAASWFPWAFWALAEHRRGQRRGLVLLPPILALTYLTGHPQEWLLLVISLSIWVAADAFCSIRRGMPGISSGTAGVLSWAGALMLGMGLSAVDLVPVYRVLPWVQKASAGEGVATLPKNYEVHPINAFQLLSPGALGGPADYFGADNYWEPLVSFGLTPLVLIAVASASFRPRSKVRGWIVLVLLAVWFAGGRQLGLYALLHRIVPGMSWFRVPGRSLFLASVGSAMLTGFGLEALELRLKRRDRWRGFARRLATIAVVMITVLLALQSAGVRSLGDRGARSTAPEVGTTARASSVGEPSGLTVPRNRDSAVRAARRILGEPSFWLTVASLSAVVGLGCIPPRWRVRGMTVSLIGVLSLGELAWHGFALLKVAPSSSFLRADPVSETLLLLTGGSAHGRETVRVRARDSVYLDLRAVHYGIEKTNINDVFQLVHAAALYETLYPVAARMPVLPESPMSLATEAYQEQIRAAVFDRMAVSYLVSDRIEPTPSWPVVTIGESEDTTYVIQRNPTAMPRAYVVPHAEITPQDPSSILTRLRTSDPRVCVLTSHDPLADLSDGERQPFSPAHWLSHDPDRPVVEVTTRAPGLLVIADTWMPGWSARVDDRPVKILRGNLAQRVIPLETRGRHRVTMEYSPPGLVEGLVIAMASGTAWLLLVLASLIDARPHRHARHRPVWSRVAFARATGRPSPHDPLPAES